MKKFIRFCFIVIFSLIITNQLWGNLDFTMPVITIVKVAFIISLFELFLKPIIKLLLLPINILTLGLIRFIINTLGLYLSVFFIGDFSVNNLYTNTNPLNLPLPSWNFSGFPAYLVTSITISFFIHILNIIFYKKVIK